jgi:hypothetical protein
MQVKIWEMGGNVPSQRVAERIEKALKPFGIVVYIAQDDMIGISVDGALKLEKTYALTHSSPLEVAKAWESLAEVAERQFAYMRSPEQAQLDNWFTYHAPVDDDAERYTAIRAAGKAFAEKIVELCPPSADRTHTIRVIRDAVFWANASIACRGK